MRFFLILLILINASPFLAKQGVGSSSACEKIRLNQSKPSVYLSFEKFGRRLPLYPGEGSEGVWLRLHNNSKWKIYVKTFGVSKEYGDVGLFYQVEKLPGMEWKVKESELPSGYSVTHHSSVRTIDSGASALFSVPREHLAEGLIVVVNFSYEWEFAGGIGGDLSIFHQAPFWSTELPKQ